MTDLSQEQLIEEHNLDPEITEHNGFTIGDQIIAVETDDNEMVYEGDEGIIVGFCRLGPGSHRPVQEIHALIDWDDRDDELGTAPVHLLEQA